MSTNNDTHAVIRLHTASQHLKQHAQFSHKTAKSHAQRASQASADLAALDLEAIFRQLHQLVAMVGGKSALDTNARDDTVTSLALHRTAQQAAE